MKDFIYADTDSIKTIGWIVDPSGSLVCYNCKCSVFPFEIENGSYNYCPNCGKKNKIEKESVI